MINFLEPNDDSIKESDKCLDPEFWNACAGTMVKMPSINTKVFYFPQGHAEHAHGNVDFRCLSSIPSYIPCRISHIKYLADPDTDEVYSKISLIPLNFNETQFLFRDDDEPEDENGKPKFFAKTLTQSDANNGGGFSVPRYCAETIFPKLDFSADPPVQTILAKDVHGEIWKFRHIYRGTPRRHLLTTGWSSFVNQKKLMAGDSIVFLRTNDGDLCVGIRRNKRGIGVGSEWTPAGGNYATPYGYGVFSRENSCKVRPESVIEAANLAASGRAFEVVYYPRASTPEFCVKASRVNSALAIHWCSGLRFKMAFETEDSSRTSWFMGTISSVHPIDPTRWPNSPWRLLQVTWDELDLLQNVKNLSPWLIELVSNIPIIPFPNPRKKLRLMSSSSPNSLPFNCLLPDNAPAGMQGARQTSSYANFHSKFQSSFKNQSITASNRINNEKVSCLLTIGDTTRTSNKPTQFVLFGQSILTEQQLSGMEAGFCCKVYLNLESEDSGRNIDLSSIGSYEELYKELENMLGMKSSDIIDHVLYKDINGSVKRIGDQSFRDFVKTAKQLTILTD